MPFDPERLIRDLRIETTATHKVRDVILYALGIGVGSEDAMSPKTLALAYEDGLRVLPSMATVLASPGFWARQPRYGIDWKRVLHGEQYLQMHRALPVEGSLTSVLTVEDIYDKGPAKGAILRSLREIYDNGTGDHLATERRATFLRGDGGKGGRSDPAPALTAVPDGSPDLSISFTTRNDQALLYRLSGDYNPLHIDPDVARAARFERPILHGLCTYGFAGRALIAALTDGDVVGLERMDCRFSSPVYPGETIVTDIWNDGEGGAAFQCRVAERDVLVLSHGRACYRIP